MTAPLRRDGKILIGSFVVSGIVHLVKPEVYEPLMPSWVPLHREVIVYSGVAEIALAAGMALRPTRKLAGLASAGLLAAVFVGNVKMAQDAARSNNLPFKVGAFARLPMQIPMVRAALRAGRA
ncbi:MAG: rane protein [Marmoricola sp.]|nr:rane protein [Marmoricola sp.]